ncbi:HNH/ENDO VII family nuclease [Gilliamella sp. ESL0254]|uniref:HNH/ENDO VII family nuclease n=1 Tax=Gilliamella sp. ESL0254 TaxID=2705035 RepID=UPI00313C250F
MFFGVSKGGFDIKIGNNIELKATNKGLVLTDEQQQKIYEDAYKEAMNQGMSAMGSSTRQGIDMAVSLINGLISGDMKGAAAGALAPKIATIIKQQTEGNTVANTVSHAILGAVVAELQGNSALVGGMGAAIGERGAEVIAGILYPDKDIKNLNQEERQQISALSQLATGLAIAAAGGDIQDVNTGVAAGKNAVENNRLLTPTEKKRIEELVKGNEREDLSYRAAACALIHCSARLADDDPDKAAYLALEELGNSPELESYREQLKGQTAEIEVELPPYITGGGKESYKKIEELFDYTTGNKISDTITYYDSEYSISTRAGGTLQVGMAVLEGMAAVALSPGCVSGFGCLPSAYLTWSMVDNGATRLMVIYNGKTYHTQTAQGLSKILGISASDAELLFSLSTGGVTAKGLSDLAWKARATGQKLSAKEVEQISQDINRVAGKGTNSATQADAAKYFGQERKYWSKDPIEFNGNKVYQRNDLFDPNLMTTWTDKGKIIKGTNLERMASGRTPIGHDGNSINLYHMTQNKNGAIAEVTQTFHQQNKTVIHVNPNTIPSGINRGEFNKWKTQYWIERAKTYR